MSDIKIGSYIIGSQHPPLIVAEMSGNHQGSLDKALQLVDAIKQAGAHALKLQTYTPDTITLNCLEGDFLITDKNSLWYGKTLYALYKEAYLPWEWHAPIMERCHALDLIVFSTPFDETAVDFLETLHVPCYKIASLEIVDLPLIRKAAQTKKPLIISTGAANLIEIGEAVKAAREAGCQELILLKCTSSYPALAKDAHVRTIPHLAAAFDVSVGLSDHTIGMGVSLAAVAWGACLIEKHVTLNRLDGGVDSAFSLEPTELQMLVKESKQAWEALGHIQYTSLLSEQTSRSHRPSLFFVQDIQPGETIQPHHIRSVRPNSGLPIKEEQHIIGLKVERFIKAGTPVTWDVFKS